MKARTGLISGLLGIAMLVLPFTASAHPYQDDAGYHRGDVSAPAPGWMVPIRDRDDYCRHYQDDYSCGDSGYDRSAVPGYNGYRPNYNQPGYYQPNYQPSYPPYGNNYGAGPQYYGAPAMGGSIASLLPQLLGNAGQRGALPYAASRSGYNDPYANANSYGYNQNQNGYGYANPGGLGSLIGPLLGNCIH